MDWRSRARGQIGGWEEQRILSKAYGFGLLGNGRETRFRLQSVRLMLAVIPQAAGDGRVSDPRERGVSVWVKDFQTGFSNEN